MEEKVNNGEIITIAKEKAGDEVEFIQRGRLINKINEELNAAKKEPDSNQDKIRELEEKLDNLIIIHKNNIDNRYKTEFLDSSGKLFEQVHALPNAVKLNIEKIKTCLIEKKQAKNAKEKIALALETLKTTGKIAAIPFLSLGKTAARYWYLVLGGLMMHNGKYLSYNKEGKTLDFDQDKLLNDLGDNTGKFLDPLLKGVGIDTEEFMDALRNFNKIAGADNLEVDMGLFGKGSIALK